MSVSIPEPRPEKLSKTIENKPQPSLSETMDVHQLKRMIELAKRAQKEFAHWKQDEVDEVVRLIGLAVHDHAHDLAVMAVEETHMGNVADKTMKNLSKSELIYEHLKAIRTVGIIHEDPEHGIIEIAEPVGVVAAIIPCTNPSVTAMSNTMFSLKSRNSIIVAPHPAAKKTTVETVKLILAYLKPLNIPEGLIQFIPEPSKELSQVLMSSADFILATGGPQMVQAAYSSGKPSYGVGPGNVPVVIHNTADVAQAVQDIIRSKTFDNGLICASEQAVIVTEDIAERVLEEFYAQGAYVVSDTEKVRLKDAMFDEEGHVKKEVIGQSADTIAHLAGFDLPPEHQKVIMVRTNYVGNQYPFSTEKLSPVLAFYVVQNFDECVRTAQTLLSCGGEGHTASIHTKDEVVAKAFALEMNASRVLVNQPSAISAGGSRQNGMVPTTTLGCGSWGGNASSDNITATHLVNIKRLAFKWEAPRDTSHVFES